MQGVSTVLRGAYGLALALALTLSSRGAAAEDSAFCRTECAAPFAERAQNTTQIQACLLRCAARSAALGKANVSSTTAMPTPQTPWTQPPVSGRAQPAQAQRPADRKIRQQDAARSRRATAEAAPPRPAPSPAPGAGPGVALGGRTGHGPYGAVYLAAAPSRGFGLVVGAGDRVMAHREAEGACRNGTGVDCRLAGDFMARCAAVAHALRSNNAVVVTAHPSTYTVTAAASGTGATREEAERQAVAACNRRGRGASCAVTEVRCAG